MVLITVTNASEVYNISLVQISPATNVLIKFGCNTRQENHKVFKLVVSVLLASRKKGKYKGLPILQKL